MPLAGLEPARYRYRGILSPLCLPIPPQRRLKYNISKCLFCQGFLSKIFKERSLKMQFDSQAVVKWSLMNSLILLNKTQYAAVVE